MLNSPSFMKHNYAFNAIERDCLLSLKIDSKMSQSAFVVLRFSTTSVLGFSTTSRCWRVLESVVKIHVRTMESIDNCSSVLGVGSVEEAASVDSPKMYENWNRVVRLVIVTSLSESNIVKGGGVSPVMVVFG
ncbi:hypothetical protein Tco_1242069 [Tanacetum coccineum]